MLVVLTMTSVNALPPKMCITDAGCNYLGIPDYGYDGDVCDQTMTRPCGDDNDCFPYTCHPTNKVCFSAVLGNLGTCSHNFAYEKDLVDSFGSICLDCFTVDGNEYDYNSPGSSQTPFASKASFQADAWTLKKIEWSTGETDEFYYEADDWYTSTGDEVDPFIPTSKNYYLYSRQKEDTGEFACGGTYGASGYETGSNTGGGLKTVATRECNGLGNCLVTRYEYEMFDDDIGCYRSSGAIGVVPLKSGWNKENDLRRPSHMGSTYTGGSVLYNEVKVILGDGSIGYEKSYYTTVDSTPENTGGSLDTDAADMFPMGVVRDYDTLGSAPAIATDWKRGMQYKSEIYSADESRGRFGLLSETKRTYRTKDNFQIFFGGIKLNGQNSLYATDLTSAEASILEGNSPAYGGGTGVKYAFGQYSGTMEISQIVDNRYGIYGADNYSTIAHNLEVDPITGTASRTLKINYDGVNTRYRTDVTEQAYLSNTDLQAKNMYASIGSHMIYDGPDPLTNNLVSGLVLTYSDYDDTADERYYIDSTQEWNDSNNNGRLDAGELISISKNMVYNTMGNVLVGQDIYGDEINIRFDSAGRPIFGWNEEYGSEADPAWEKTYYENGMLESLTDENGMTIFYLYDNFGRSWKTIKQGDNFYNPTSETTYGDYNNINSPRWILTKTKISDFGFTYTKSFVDGFDKPIQTQVKMSNDEADATWLVTITTYDEFGRKVREYQPFEWATGGNYFTAEIPGTVKYTEYEYYPEPLLRVKQKTLADGSVVAYLYGTNNGVPTITVKDANDQVKRFTYDWNGNLIKVEEGFTGTISTLFPE